jgi:putative hemolysin
MKILILALAIASGAYAQSCSGVQITDTLYTIGNGNVTLMQGTIDLSLRYSLSGTSGPIVQSTARVTVTNGALSYCAPAGASITAVYTVRRPSPLTGSVTFTRYWGIPASGGPYTLLVDHIETASAIANPTAAGTYCLVKSGGVLTWTSGACSTGNLFDTLTGLLDSLSGQFDSL